MTKWPQGVELLKGPPGQRKPQPQALAILAPRCTSPGWSPVGSLGGRVLVLRTSEAPLPREDVLVSLGPQ